MTLRHHLSNSKNFGLMVLTVALWVFSFPVAWKGELISPAWLNALCVCLYFFPLLKLNQNLSPKMAFRLTYLITCIAYYFILNWLSISMRVYALMHPALAQSMLLLTVFLIAFYPALGMYLYKKMSPSLDSAALNICKGVLVFALVEYLRQITPFGGFPWVMPAYGLHSLSLLCQSVDIFGVLGLSLCLYVFQFCAYAAWQYKKPRCMSFAILLLAALSLYGYMQTQSFSKKNALKTLKIGWVQGNIAQDIKWTDKGRKLAMDVYSQATQNLIEQGAQVIVWPEAAVTHLYYQKAEYNAFSADYLQDRTLIFGAPSYAVKNQQKVYQNSVFAVTQDNKLVTRSDKNHLVPFGEYLPWPIYYLENILPALVGNFIPNPDVSLISTQHAQFATLICYESLFGYISNQKVALGADIILNLTNDAWFNKSSGPYQHKIFSQFRALETRRSLVRAANTGISTWYDATGKEGTQLGLFKRGALIADIPIYTQRSFFNRYPYALPITLILCFFGFLSFTFIQTNPLRKK